MNTFIDDICLEKTGFSKENVDNDVFSYENEMVGMNQFINESISDITNSLEYLDTYSKLLEKNIKQTKEMYAKISMESHFSTNMDEYIHKDAFSSEGVKDFAKMIFKKIIGTILKIIAFITKFIKKLFIKSGSKNPTNKEYLLNNKHKKEIVEELKKRDCTPYKFKMKNVNGYSKLVMELEKDMVLANQFKNGIKKVMNDDNKLLIFKNNKFEVISIVNNTDIKNIISDSKNELERKYITDPYKFHEKFDLIPFDDTKTRVNFYEFLGNSYENVKKIYELFYSDLVKDIKNIDSEPVRNVERNANTSDYIMNYYNYMINQVSKYDNTLTSHIYSIYDYITRIDKLIDELKK